MGLLVSAKGAPTPRFASCYPATRGNRTVSRPAPYFVMLSLYISLIPSGSLRYGVFTALSAIISALEPNIFSRRSRC
jgi:hypothetical protein